MMRICYVMRTKPSKMFQTKEKVCPKYFRSVLVSIPFIVYTRLCIHCLSFFYRWNFVFVISSARFHFMSYFMSFHNKTFNKNYHICSISNMHPNAFECIPVQVPIFIAFKCDSFMSEFIQNNPKLTNSKIPRTTITNEN